MRRRLFLAASGIVVAAAAALAGQPPQPAQPQFDAAAVERGQRLHVAECGFCHGPTARGGSSGPDLTRSVLVLDDEKGKQLGDFLRVGRPDRGMPKFDLPAAQVSDLATFLHSTIHLAANRRLYKILDILVGDAKAGETFFYGAGKCGTCHSTQLDLRGVGAKYDPTALQQRMLMPRGGRAGPAFQDRNAIKVSVTLPSGEAAHGALVRLTDFEVTLYDATTGMQKSWLRNGETPRVVVTDPLQGHMDLLTKWTDADMHNVTAYLASLK
jgi:cytochrome c oxidase cbb3-type subunit III